MPLRAAPTGADDAVGRAQLEVMRASIDALRAEYPSDGLVPDEVTERLLELVALRGENRDVIAALRALRTTS